MFRHGEACASIDALLSNVSSVNFTLCSVAPEYCADRMSDTLTGANLGEAIDVVSEDGNGPDIMQGAGQPFTDTTAGQCGRQNVADGRVSNTLPSKQF